MSARALELLISKHGDMVLLQAPAVGLFTQASPKDSLLQGGMEAGQLLILSTPHTLLVPSGIHGRIQGPNLPLVHQPVAYGTLLYSLARLGADSSNADATDTDEQPLDALVLKSPQTGRFYHRPSPKEDPFVHPGDLLTPGQVIGMIEVMKTFTTVSFPTGPEWPAKVRLQAWQAGDGSEVTAGDALASLEEG